jgi:aminopeptidase N
VRSVARTTLLGPLAVLILATSCSTGSEPEPTPSPTSTPSTASAVAAEPWPDRPVITLDFDVADDLSTVVGRETVSFTPDAQVCEMVFRTWANKPELAASGTSLTVDAVSVDGQPATARIDAAGAPPGAPGSLVEVPLPACVEAGTTVNAELGFTLVLGEDAGERTGRSQDDRSVWLATAFPLLAWERERGWARDPAVDLFGETAASEDFRLERLDVVAPADLDVLSTGTLQEQTEGPRPGTATHQFTADAVRDIAVTVGDYDIVERDVDGVRLHVAVPTAGVNETAAALADTQEASLRGMTALLGPFPYPDLSVTVVPAVGTGIEFPGAIFYGDLNRGRRETITHETAHMYFYGLVGNNQGRDPWLDESFATYAQAIVDGQVNRFGGFTPPPYALGQVGQPMTYWEAQPQTYGPGVYGQGAQALLQARQAVGAAAFDEAIRSYVAENAHQVATPDDVASALAGFPEAIAILREVGALQS